MTTQKIAKCLLAALFITACACQELSSDSVDDYGQNGEYFETDANQSENEEFGTTAEDEPDDQDEQGEDGNIEADTSQSTVEETDTTAEGQQGEQGEGPVVSFGNITDGQGFSQRIENITVIASDDDGIEKVELFIDNDFIREEKQDPYEWRPSNDSVLLTMENGDHVLKAVAYDSLGNSSEVSITITLAIDGGDDTDSDGDDDDVGSVDQVTLIDEAEIAPDGLYFWFPNGKEAYVYGPAISPHGDCVTIANGYVFFTWYKGGMTDRHLMVSRMKIGNNKWVHVQLTPRLTMVGDGRGDSHRTAAIAVSTRDNTIHLIFNHHNDPLRYIGSQKNAAFVADNQFKASLFNPQQDYLKKGEPLRITYPKLLTNNAGELILLFRKGSAIGGNEHSVYYDGNAWSSVKVFMNGGNVPEEKKNYAYGSPSYQNGQIYYAFTVRWKHSEVRLNEDVYIAKCGQRISGYCETVNGKRINLPIEDYSPFKIGSPKITDNYGMSGSSNSRRFRQ